MRPPRNRCGRTVLRKDFPIDLVFHVEPDGFPPNDRTREARHRAVVAIPERVGDHIPGEWRPERGNAGHGSYAPGARLHGRRWQVARTVAPAANASCTGSCHPKRSCPTASEYRRPVPSCSRPQPGARRSRYRPSAPEAPRREATCQPCPRPGPPVHPPPADRRRGQQIAVDRRPTRSLPRPRRSAELPRSRKDGRSAVWRVGRPAIAAAGWPTPLPRAAMFAVERPGGHGPKQGRRQASGAAPADDVRSRNRLRSPADLQRIRSTT